MKRARFARRGGHTRDADNLVRLAASIGASGSRLEDNYWESRLAATIDRLLADDEDAIIDAALDRVYRENIAAYDGLADLVEARAESRALRLNDVATDILMFAAPILVWSRYTIPSGHIPREVLAELRVQLQANILAKDAKLALADFLYSADQLPEGFGTTYRLTDTFAAPAMAGRDVKISAEELPPTNHFFADVRYLLGAVAVPTGAALFRWQDEDGSREAAIAQWSEQSKLTLKKLFPGCAFEPLGPDAYFAACRRADRQARPYALRASVDFLHAALGFEPATMTAVVAPFYDNQLEEYRIGFLHQSETEVVHGVVWPLLDAEDESNDSITQIEAELRGAGIADVRVLEQRFPIEFCEDCGSPLYPDTQGEIVHAEMPEQDQPASAHLH